VVARVVEQDLLVDASTPELPDGSARAGEVLDQVRHALLLSVVSSLRS
jgi:hypothetical protein